MSFFDWKLRKKNKKRIENRGTIEDKFVWIEDKEYKLHCWRKPENRAWEKKWQMGRNAMLLEMFHKDALTNKDDKEAVEIATAVIEEINKILDEVRDEAELDMIMIALKNTNFTAEYIANLPTPIFDKLLIVVRNHFYDLPDDPLEYVIERINTFLLAHKDEAMPVKKIHNMLVKFTQEATGLGGNIKKKQ